MITISKTSKITVGLAITLAGAIWHMAGVTKQVDFNTQTIMKMDTKNDAKFEIILSKLSAIDVIKSQIEDLRKPIINTQFNVKRVMKRKFERTAEGPVKDKDRAFSGACEIGPYSLNEY